VSDDFVCEDNKMFKWVRGLAALILVAGSATAAMADASGQALGVDPQAEAEGRDGTRTLVVGDDVFIGDRVVTGPAGQVQILFSDSTKLVVGPRSALLIEDYLLRDNGSAGKFAINALSGTFRFVTGTSPKDRYVIKTPTGTIGVRGTGVELYVTALWVYMLVDHGGIISCPDDGSDCMILDGECEYGIMGVNSTQLIGHTDGVTGEDRKDIKTFFKYAEDESDLDHKFRISGSQRCLDRPVGAGAGGSLSGPPAATLCLLRYRVTAAEKGSFTSRMRAAASAVRANRPTHGPGPRLPLTSGAC
jgi:hypothetical protein